MLTEEEIAQLKQLLVSPKSMAIIAHRNPDGDALGSSLALQLYLESLGHTVKVVMPSESPKTFRYLPNFGRVNVFDLEHDRCRKILDDAEMIFCLDFNSLDRIDKLGENVQFSKAKKVLIDHHLDPEPFADYIFSDTAASSTCELVYRFVCDMGDQKWMNKDFGDCILTGLITDTGSFKYATTPDTYRIASELKLIGVDDYFIQDRIFNSLKEKNLRLLGHCLANRMELIPEYRTGLIYLTKKDYADFQIVRGDTEGIVNYLLMMENIDVAAFITEQPTIIKISLRSKGDISVQRIAMKHFNGGGHKNASGGSAYAKLDDVIDRFKKVIPKYLPKQVV